MPVQRAHIHMLFSRWADLKFAWMERACIPLTAKMIPLYFFVLPRRGRDSFASVIHSILGLAHWQYIRFSIRLFRTDQLARIPRDIRSTLLYSIYHGPFPSEDSMWKDSCCRSCSLAICRPFADTLLSSCPVYARLRDCHENFSGKRDTRNGRCGLNR